MEENVLSSLFLSLCSSFKQILGLKKHFFLTSSFFILLLLSICPFPSLWIIYLFIAVSYFSGLEFFVQFYQKEKKMLTFLVVLWFPCKIWYSIEMLIGSVHSQGTASPFETNNGLGSSLKYTGTTPGHDFE